MFPDNMFPQTINIILIIRVKKSRVCEQTIETATVVIYPLSQVFNSSPNIGFDAMPAHKHVDDIVVLTTTWCWRDGNSVYFTKFALKYETTRTTVSVSTRDCALRVVGTVGEVAHLNQPAA